METYAPEISHDCSLVESCDKCRLYKYCVLETQHMEKEVLAA